jgi:predicted  nucleic acid-binding Zn-ribbon protein
MAVETHQDSGSKKVKKSKEEKAALKEQKRMAEAQSAAVAVADGEVDGEVKEKKSKKRSAEANGAWIWFLGCVDY